MNLLPEVQKTNFDKGLKIRFFIVLSVLLSLGILASSIMLVPSYFAAKIELEDLLSQTKFAKKEIDEDTQRLLQLPQELNTKIQFIKSNTNNKSAFFIISRAIEHKPIGISINSISSINIKDADRVRLQGVTVSGIAKDRKSLIDYSKSLEEEKSFAKVDVPVSSLTKETNLPFSISISLSN